MGAIGAENMFASAGFNCAISRVRFNLAHARQSRTNVSYRNGRKYHPIQASADKAQVIQPIAGDPFIGMLETPVTSAPVVSNFLSNLPAYRTGVKPLLRGGEIGLTHGFLLGGPFAKLGPLRNAGDGTAEV